MDRQAAAGPWRAPPRGNTSCPNDCNGVGNCNYDTGLCECPAGTHACIPAGRRSHLCRHAFVCLPGAWHCPFGVRMRACVCVAPWRMVVPWGMRIRACVRLMHGVASWHADSAAQVCMLCAHTGATLPAEEAVLLGCARSDMLAKRRSALGHTSMH
eukprot:363419-Chlamydomonas_euryale.AAC.21